MSRYNKLQTYILKKYSRTFLEIRLDHGVSLISQHSLEADVSSLEVGISK